eukprot:5043785-Amphidinium_carterae.2
MPAKKSLYLLCLRRPDRNGRSSAHASFSCRLANHSTYEVIEQCDVQQAVSMKMSSTSTYRHAQDSA